MSKWPMRSLEEISTLLGGGTPSRENSTYWDGTIPWVTPTDLPVPESGVATIAATKDCITEQGLSASSATLVPPGTVLFSSRATIGKVAVANTYVTTNQGFANLVPGSDVTSRFLAYSLWYRRENIARLSGSTTFKEVSRSTLRRFRIPIPPLAEQEQIVRLLDEADAIRKLRAQADQRTADLIPSLFHEMFGDPVTNPMGWPMQPLGDLVTLVSGGTPSRSNAEFWNGTVPWVSPKDMKLVDIAASQEKISSTALSETSLRLIPDSTVLIVVRGMILAHTVPIGITRVPVTINQDMKALVPKHPINADYLVWALLAQHQKLLSLVSTAGHGTKRLDTGAIESILVPLPPSTLQETFAQRAVEVQNMQKNQVVRSTAGRAMFDALMRQYF